MIVGTAGHIDHGKTALVRALTGVDTDRLPAEKARGITIDLGFAYRRVSESGTLGFVDVPGHEKFIHNMVAGAAGIDFMLLVIAADDGPMPQTREHLQIVDLLGVERGIVVLSKCDLVDAERIAELEAELRSLLAGTALAGAEIVPVSAVTGEGIATLEACLFDAARGMPPPCRGGRFRLAVDRSFSLPGIGTVVTGTVFAGAVRIGDRLAISPSGLAARVRGIHAQNAPAEQGEAGQRCALNLVGAGIDRDCIHRGDWVVDAALHAPTERLDARIRLLASEERPLRHAAPVQLHLGAARVPAQLALLDRERLLPGEEALVQIALDRPLGALHGDHIVFRDHSARRTIGGGVVLDPWPPQRGRRRPQRLAMLGAMAEPDAQQALLRLLSEEPGWVDLKGFARARNLTAEAAEELWRTSEIVRVDGGGAFFAFGRDNWQILVRLVGAVLAEHHRKVPESPGLEENRLRRALGNGARGRRPARWAVVAIARSRGPADTGRSAAVGGHPRRDATRPLSAAARAGLRPDARGPGGRGASAAAPAGPDEPGNRGSARPFLPAGDCRRPGCGRASSRRRQPGRQDHGRFLPRSRR